MKFLVYCFLSMLLVAHLKADDEKDYRGQYCYYCGRNNPCGKQVGGYFSYCGNPYQFLQCGANNLCFYMSCPAGTVWFQENKTCEKDPYAPYPPPGTSFPYGPCPAGKYNCKDKNPCTDANRNAKNFYFDHDKSGLYVQCDNFKVCFEQLCPSGLAWEPASCTCVKSSLP